MNLEGLMLAANAITTMPCTYTSDESMAVVFPQSCDTVVRDQDALLREAIPNAQRENRLIQNKQYKKQLTHE